MSAEQGPRLLFVCGDKSGSGKSTLCMGLLNSFLLRGYEARHLAYIKPATQCVDVTLVSKFCEKKGIAHRGMGPVRFYKGLTAECINGEDEGAESRLKRIHDAVQQIGQGKRIVLVDGVGYPAVGSVIGMSNAQVAAHLGSPVIIVGKPGVGDAIDSLNYNLAYFEKFKVPVVGACWNMVGPLTTYHTYEDCATLVPKYCKQYLPDLALFGHIPSVIMREDVVANGKADGDEPVACYLRERKEDLQMTATEEANILILNKVVAKYFDTAALLQVLGADIGHEPELPADEDVEITLESEAAAGGGGGSCGSAGAQPVAKKRKTACG